MTNSLVLEYNSYEYSGSGTSISDTSTNSRNGTIGGSPTYSNDVFTWTDSDYLRTPDLSSIIQNNSEAHTIELWIKPINNGVLAQYNGQDNHNTDYHFSALEIVSGKLEFGLWNGVMVSSGPTVNIPFNQWNHVVLTYDGSIIKGYLNGVFVTGSETTVNWDHPKEYSSSNKFVINFGAEDTTNQGDGTRFDGQFAVSRVYNRALSLIEVVQNYNYPYGTLKIVESGGDSINTTWREDDNTIYAKSNASINSSIIEGYLNSGSLSVTANVIEIQDNITTNTAGNNIVFKAKSDIVLNSNITTNNGDVHLWSDSDGNSAGRIGIYNGGITSNGGDITLSGGTDGNSYAVGTNTAFTSFANYRGIWFNNSTLNANGTSNGGNIIIKGKGYTNELTTDYNIGVDFTINSIIKTNFNGEILIDGVGGPHSTAGEHAAGINFFSQNQIFSADGTIELNGEAGGGSASNARLDAGINFDGGLSGATYDAKIYSNSGDITLKGTKSTLSNSYGIMNGIDNIQTYIGTDGTNKTSGDITIISDNFDLQDNYHTIETTGALVIKSSSNSFSTNFNTSLIDIPSSLNSLTIGTISNTANITISEDIEVAGPISMYGDDIVVSGSISSTKSNSNILLKAKGYIYANTNHNISTNGGDIILWSNTANTTSGTANNEVDLRGNNTISTSGGDIYLAGGLDDGNGRPAGYAYRSYDDEIRPADLGTNVTLNSAGGNIFMRGQGGGVGIGFTGSGIDIDSSGGSVTLDGIGNSNRGIWIGHNLDLNSNGGDIIMTGTSTSSYGIGFENSGISIDSGTGSITIVGQSTSNHGVSVTNQLAINSDSNSDTAISIKGSSSSAYGVFFGGTTSSENLLIQSSSTEGGGDIVIEGKTVTGEVGVSLDFWRSGSSTQILSGSGNIKIHAKGNESRTLYTSTDLHIGKLANSNAVNGISPISSVTTGNISMLSDGGIRTNTGAGGKWTITSGDAANPGGDVVIASDTNNSEGGFMYFSTGGLSVNSYGGNITLGGGNLLGTGYAIGTRYNSSYSGNGIQIDGNLSLNSSGNSTDTGGNINIRAKGYTGSWEAYNMNGFFKYLGSTDINSGTGKINISALAPTPQTNATAVGFYINGGTNHYFTSSSTSADAIKIVGDSSDSSSSTSEGIILRDASGRHEFVATGVDGGVIITAKGGDNDPETTQFNDPVYVLANGGDIKITAESEHSNGGSMIFGDSPFYGSKSSSSVSSSNSNIILKQDKFTFSSGVSPKIATTGNVSIIPSKTRFTNTTFETDWFAFNQNSQTMSGLTIGKESNTSDITINSDQTVNGPIAIYGDDITLSNSLTASGTLTLQSSGALTQTASISANILSLTGSGTTNLSHSGNSVNKLSAGTATITTGTLSFTNSKALEIGVNTNGIKSNGTISIGTLSGNLTLSKDITTTNTSDNAIRLLADADAAAPNEGNGHIIISGTPTLTTGSGGRVSLFSGKPASSSGLVNLVGNNNVRIGVDSSTTTFEPGLNSGVYALFRTGPKINLSETSLSFAHTSGTNSLPKSFVLSATGLTENVTLTAPNGFEISETENSGYTSSLNMTQSSGSITNTPIYVRVKNSASDYPTGTLSASSEGAFSESLGLTTTANAALDLDGVDDYVDTGSTMFTTGQNNFTIEAWVYSKNPENDNLYHGIIGVEGTSRSPGIWIKNRELHYDFRNSNATGTQIGALFSYEDIRANEWFHIAWVKSGALTYFYINGKLVIDGNPAPTSLYVEPQNYRLGYINNYFKGQLDEVRFWNTAQTQVQIQENMYRSLSGNSHSGLISSYNFNNGVPLSDNSSNTTLYDAVGNNDGTLTNFGNLSIASATTSTWVANPFPESEIPNGYSSMPTALWNAIGTNETRDSNGLTLTAPSTLSAENYVNLAANTDTGTTTSDVGNTENIRSNRIWYVNETGSVSATVKIGVASATGQTVSSFVSPTFSLIRRDGTSEDFSRVAQGTRSGDVVTFTEVGLEDGYYSLGVVQNVLLIPTASQSKTLGAEEPTLSYTTSPNVSLSGTLSRTAGEDVGTYSITIGTISSSLYSITLAPENFEIVVTDPNINGWNDLSLTFGDTSGVPSYTTSATTSPSFTSSNTSVAAIHPSSGTITATGVGTTTLWIYFPAGGQFVSGTKSLTITVLARTITVTAAAKTKVFGESDPELTYTATPAVGDPVVAGSSATVSFTGTLIRTDGENAGTYSITLGTLSNTNYTIDYVGADFSITKAPTDIDDGDSDPATETLSDTTITFGDADLLLTPTSSNTADYTFTSSDSSVASITTTSTNTASIRNMGVGSAVISISQAADPNYQAKTVSYTLTVNRLPVTVIPTTTQSKTYGEADLTLTYDSSPELNSSLSNSSTITFTGTLSRTDGTNVGTYSITIGTLTNTNYALTFTETDYTINQRPITISAEAKTKVYGSADPSLTHSITAGSIVTGDTVSGVLTRTSGEAAGTYSIAQNTLTYGNNYNETYEAADLTITNATLTLTVSDYTKVYDSQFIDSSNLSFTATGLVNGNSIDDLVGTPTYTVAGTATNTVGTYSITLSGLSHPSYDIVFVGANATIMQRDMSEVIVADISDRVYNGLAQTLSPTASLNSLSLVEGTDYTTSFTGNTNVGTASVTLTGLGNFTGSKTVPFKIVAANIASTTITGLPSQTFTGFTLTPSPSLSYNGNLLVESSDYSVSYKGNTNAGTASVTFIGSGNYTGTHVIGFEIEKADLNISFENITTTFGAIDFKPSLTISDTSTIPILSPSANTNPRFWYANSIYGDARIFYPSDYERKETFFKPSLNSERSWIAEGSGSSYLALDLQEEVLIYGIKTKGNARNPKWVKTAKIQYTSVLETSNISDVGREKIGESNWTTIEENASLNTDNTTAVINLFESPVTARYLNVLPSSHQVDVSMRLGVLYIPGNLVLSSSNSSIVSFSDNIASVNGGGIATVTATIPESLNYNAYSTTFTIEVESATPSINFPNVTKTFGDVPFALTATSSNTSNKIFTVSNTDVATVSGDTITIVGAGTTSVTLTQEADGNYTAATATMTLVVNKATPSFTVSDVTKIYGDLDFAIDNNVLISNSPGSIVYTSSDTSVATISGTSNVHNLGSGSTIITASQSATDNYLSGTTSFTLIVNPLEVNVLANAKTKVHGDADPVLNITSSPSLGTVLSNGDNISFTGTLSRTPGENVGIYPISIGTLTNTNYDITFTPANLSITKLPVTITPTSSQSKTYGEIDTTLTFTASPAVNSTLTNTTSTITFTGSLSRTTGENVNNYTINIGTLTNTNYNITLSPETFAINKKTITVSGITAGDKVYDANTNASVDLSGITFTGKETGDTITATVTGTFDTKDIGTAKTVNLSATYSSSALDNYTIVDQSSTTASITAKTITATLTGTVDKIYNSTTSATLSAANYELSGFVSGESATITQTFGTYDSKNIGTNKEVSVSLSNAYAPAFGTLLSNYILAATATGTVGNITAKTLTVTNITALDKVYDGSTNSNINSSTIVYNGLESGDDVSINSTSGVFDNENVGVGKAVYLTNTYTGGDLSNYTLVDQALATASITAKTVSASLIGSVTKVYNGTLSATLNPSNFQLNGVISGQSIGVNQTFGTYDTKEIGTSKMVTVDLTDAYLADSGTLLSNYVLAATATGTVGTITAKTLTVTGIVVLDKVYDGTVSSTVMTNTIAYEGLAAGDNVYIDTSSGVFADANVGQGKTVNLTNTYAGTDLTNYTVVNQATTTASVTTKPITIIPTAGQSKTYGLADATLSYTISPSTLPNGTAISLGGT
ncbi:YDG domain-containing protein, partial [Flavobacteriaceae bacterium LSUCC0859]|nr:YDG domain-containing protein [Flavobacteriaceae bacterium LSUCC0859]